MNNEEKKELILKFINGPLKEYLDGEISFSRFKELINEACGTDFSYSELYPSYLFNLEVAQKTAIIDIKAIRQPQELSDFDQ